MNSEQPDFLVKKEEWETAHELLKQRTALTPEMDELLTALSMGKAEVRESWGVKYRRARSKGIYIDYPPRIPPISGAEWEVVQTHLELAGRLSRDLDMCLKGLIEGWVEVTKLSDVSTSATIDDDIPF